jgi:hypothetical protein
LRNGEFGMRNEERSAELTRGIGVDAVLENTGSVAPIDESLDIVRKGGKILWSGGGIRGASSPRRTHTRSSSRRPISSAKFPRSPMTGTRPFIWPDPAGCS